MLIEVILKSQLTWQNDLEISQRMVTATIKPVVEVLVNSHPALLPETLSLQDFHSPRVMNVFLHSDDLVVPNVFQASKLVAKKLLRDSDSKDARPLFLISTSLKLCRQY